MHHKKVVFKLSNKLSQINYKKSNRVFTSNLILRRIIKKKLAVGIEIERIANNKTKELGKKSTKEEENEKHNK